MASTRFPGKPLCDLAGKPMIQWVVEAATASLVADRVIVATPDQEIVDRCADFDAEAILTRTDHPSGTDRIAEVVSMVEADVYLNVQGDEPLIRSATIRACAEPLIEHMSLQMSSVYADCRPEDLENPNVVKVVTDAFGFAVYFSRACIPFERNPRPIPVKRHFGIYAYRREAVLAFSRWEPSPLEIAEGLEQLRFLENGVRIKMVKGEPSGIGVDTPEQAEEVRRILYRSPSQQIQS